MSVRHNMPTDSKLDALVATLRDAVSFTYAVDSDGRGDDSGYSRSADAMWKAALAAFNWAADEVGATGFQAGWAALRFYGQAMHIDGPYMVLQLRDVLYPQYDLPAKVSDWLRENRGYLAEEARKRLAEYEQRPVVSYTDDDGVAHSSPSAHPDVVAHWRRLVADALDAGRGEQP